jgi:hypothetical protein
MLFSSRNSLMIATALAAPQPDPFHVLDRVAVALLLLGGFLLFIPLTISLVVAPHVIRPDFVFLQLFYFYGFAVVETFGLVILWARGHMPRMSEETLKSIFRWTVGTLAELLSLAIREITKRFSKSKIS